MMGHTTPFVSVIVPVLNGERTIRDCLVSLLRMDYPPELREILVVDNGSTDGTAEIVKSFPVRYLQEERRGASYARNRGIEESKGEILAFTDADCIATTGWVRELVQGFKDDGIGGVDGETLAYLPATPAEQYMARWSCFNYQVRLASPFFPYAITANVAFRREVFHQIGFFDSRFPAAGGEDIDFSWRFSQETNLKLQHNPKAVVFHRHRSTTRSYFSQHMRNGRALVILQSKYPARLPWGWRKEFWAWCDLALNAWISARAAIRYWLGSGKKMDVYDPYFTFLRKLALRVGFIRETLARRP
ncbi:glycosyltransferase [Nitrospinae bacterium AH-259-F20]|nr:glycosyltransferase [Nitrospinae bacterium AH-259-F20]